MGWRRAASCALAVVAAAAALQCGGGSSKPSDASANAGSSAGGATGGADVGGAEGASLSGAAGSSESNGEGGTNSGGMSATAAGASGDAGHETVGSGGAVSAGAGGVGSIGVGLAGAAGSSGNVCSIAAVFEPRTPVVFFLLSRSASMFAPTDHWSVLKSSILSTIRAFEAQVRFGFAAYTGVTGATCPLDLTRAGVIALDNYDAINAVLAPLGAAAGKAETPIAAALAAVRPTLSAESGADKSIFLITAGSPDFCDDGNTACASDAVVSELQQNFNAGIRGSLFGLSGDGSEEPAQLQAQATAAAGLLPAGNASNLYLACNGAPAWHALWTTLGRGANQALGNYAAGSGDIAPYTLLDTTVPASVTAALMNAVTAQKSCTFELASGHLTLGGSEPVTVSINGVQVPEDANDGFRVNSTTELELRGAACASWRTPAVQTIHFDVPCSGFVP